ncbi:MAG: calcium/sodium antiporter [Actinomycetia bacterium]|nr:calcium/sodium antiporter [Actinomycetes bacterium]
MLVAVPVLIAGLVMLVQGADRFVDGAAAIAVEHRLSPVLVGAVVIGFGTSAPEMVVSAIASARGEVALGVGNIVGSNVANLTLVLGVAALITPLVVDRGILLREGPLAISAVALAAALFSDGEVERWEGVVFAFAMVVALGLIIRGGLDVEDVTFGESEDERSQGRLAAETGLGLVMTVVGAQVVVWSATEIADEFELSGGFVGFTLVALGTSLPELGTTVAACRKGQTGLVVGNLLGSNIFNSLAVGGIVGLVGPGAIGDDLLSTRGSILMVVAVLLSYVFAFNGRRVNRAEGVVLLVLYIAAIALLAGGSTIQ